jgi:hypothetical protein
LRESKRHVEQDIIRFTAVIFISTIINSNEGDAGDETGSQYSSESYSSRSTTASSTVSYARRGEKNENIKEKTEKIDENKDSDSDSENILTLAKKLDILQASFQKPTSPVLKAPRVETMAERLSKHSSVTRAAAMGKKQRKIVVKSSCKISAPVKNHQESVPGNPQNQREESKLRPTSPSKDKAFQRKPFNKTFIPKERTPTCDTAITDNFSWNTVAPTVQYMQSPVSGFIKKTEAEGSLAAVPSSVPLNDGQLRTLMRIRQKATSSHANHLSSAEFIESISTSISIGEDIKKRLERLKFIDGVPTEDELKEQLIQMQESSTSKLSESRNICNSILGVWKNNIDTHLKLANASSQELYDKEFQKPMKIENIFREEFASKQKGNAIGITGATFLTSLKDGTNVPLKPTAVMLSNARKSPRKMSAEKRLETSCRQYDKAEWKRALLIFKENSWFISLIIHIMSYRKKTPSQKIPTNCYIFLGAVQRVLSFGFKITADTCFSIIDQCIKGSQHRETIVYKILHPVLQCASVRPSAFMSWLKQKEYLPSPKHLSDVKKLSRKAYLRASRKSKSFKHALTNVLPALNEEEGDENMRYPHDAGYHPARPSYKTLLDLKITSPSSCQGNLGGFGIVRKFSVSSISDSGDGDDDGISVFGSEMDFDENFSDFGDAE